MNIIRFKGGLGNQMFQYALYLAFIKCKIKVAVDISSYIKGGDYIHNGFELNKIFELDKDFNNIQFIEDSILIDSYPLFKFRRLLGLFFNDINFFVKKTHYLEKNYSGYYPEVFNLQKSYIDGYWQSEKYFEFFSSDLLKSFSWKAIKSENKSLSIIMNSQNSVSIHIRRPDKIKKLSDIYHRLKLFFSTRIADSDYYFRAIELIEKKVSDPVFYVFTDNQMWVKENFDLDKNFILVDWNEGHLSYQDMYLMSNCKHNIISISTFSWWGAWLNKNTKKIVIAPKLWASKLFKDIYIIPDSWLRL
tara:strand:+ start:918 stop:1829 length:912 start_codon:yes stop_codon:yes gene_type:complete